MQETLKSHRRGTIISQNALSQPKDRLCVDGAGVHRGGYGEIVKLDARYTRAAVEATRVVGLQIAGVDMLVGKDGPKVMEISIDATPLAKRSNYGLSETIVYRPPRVVIASGQSDRQDTQPASLPY